MLEIMKPCSREKNQKSKSQ